MGMDYFVGPVQIEQVVMVLNIKRVGSDQKQGKMFLQ